MSNLKAIKRENTSSGSNNKLRSEGLIPAILYGGKEANKNISIEKKEIKNLIHSDTFLSKVLDLVFLLPLDLLIKFSFSANSNSPKTTFKVIFFPFPILSDWLQFFVDQIHSIQESGQFHNHSCLCS